MEIFSFNDKVQKKNLPKNWLVLELDLCEMTKSTDNNRS